MTENGGKREGILKAIQAALGARGDEPGRRGIVRARLERSPHGLIPARGRQPATELVAQFSAMMAAQGVVVRTVARAKALPQAIAEQLAEFNLPARLRHGEEPLFASLPWDKTLIECDLGPADPADAVSLSRAMAGAAESGTLFLASGRENPSTLNFLPETHLVALLADDLVGSQEEAWDAVRAKYGRGFMPRTVNLVSGPSASADIEQMLIRGAHGPRRLAVFVIQKK